MNSSFTTCSYHPNRIALSVCECCRRPICIQDQRLLKKNILSEGVVQHYYCKICYSTISVMNSNSFFFFIIIGILYVILFVVLQNNKLMYIVDSIFFPLLIISIISDNKSVGKASIAKTEALLLKDKSYDKKNPDTIPSFDYSKKDIEKALEKQKSPYNESEEPYPSITCFECGSRFYIEDMFCKSCGYLGQDELIKEYNIFLV